jgi:tetratricopeptide (TPR) repeat protein
MTAAYLGQTLVFSGRAGQPEEALTLFQRAIRLSPYTPPPILFYEGLAYRSLGRYKQAMSMFEQERAANPQGQGLLAFLALTSADLGRMEEAHAAAEVLKSARHYRGFSANSFVNALDYKDSAKSERTLATLLQLGLTE